MAAYAFGLGAMALMLYARSLSDPVARSEWTRHSTLCLGLMLTCFVTYYILTLLRIKRP